MSVHFSDTDTFKNVSDKAKEISTSVIPGETQMGCFLGCFGFEKSRKRRKSGINGKRSSPVGHGRYVPLDSDVSLVVPEIEENHLSSVSCVHLKEKPRGPLLSKIKKRVRFDLDVKVYEPIRDEDDDIGLYNNNISEVEEETAWEFSTEPGSLASARYEEDLVGPRASSESSPANRYQNCRYEEEEEEDEVLEFEEDGLNYEETEDSEEENYDVYADEDLNPVVMNSTKEIINDQISDDFNGSPEPLKSNTRARDRGKYVFNVLNPVENLSQWKAIKSKAATQKLIDQKENLVLEQEGRGKNLSSTESGSEDLSAFKEMGRRPAEGQGTIAVNVSLTNWL